MRSDCSLTVATVVWGVSAGECRLMTEIQSSPRGWRERAEGPEGCVATGQLNVAIATGGISVTACLSGPWKTRGVPVLRG